MKKIGIIYCFLLSLILIATPLISATGLPKNSFQAPAGDVQLSDSGEGQPSAIGGGYLLLLVFTYAPGKGINPYQGANITVRGLFHSYNGTTDQNGICLLKVRSPLLHEKIYFVKTSIISNNRTISRHAVLEIRGPRISYKGFLFFTRN
jgi:hypothetical protein